MGERGSCAPIKPGGVPPSAKPQQQHSQQLHHTTYAICGLGPFNSGGEINIGGSVSGNIELYETVGALHITNDLSGDVEIEEDLTGSVTVDGDVSGDIQLLFDLIGSVTVGGALANGGVGGGRILVSGETTGTIKVGKSTASLTLIQLAGGLASGATLEINTTRGNFGVGGDIQLGGPYWISSSSPPPLTFDGCIRIYDDAGAPPKGGNLKGDLTVIGCHATADDLNICVDGNDNGHISIVQIGCTNQVDWSCSGCP